MFKFLRRSRNKKYRFNATSTGFARLNNGGSKFNTNNTIRNRYKRKDKKFTRDFIHIKRYKIWKNMIF